MCIRDRGQGEGGSGVRAGRRGALGPGLGAGGQLGAGGGGLGLGAGEHGAAGGQHPRPGVADHPLGFGPVTPAAQPVT